MSGWIKLHRKMLDNPVVMKDADHLAVWAYLLLNATHKKYPTTFGGKKIVLEPGQLITGRRKIADDLQIDQQKIRRILKILKNEQQIDQRAEPYGSLITILNWDRYQSGDQQNDQRATNKRPTNDQQNDHYTRSNKEYKEGGEVGGPRRKNRRLDWIDEA